MLLIPCCKGKLIIVKFELAMSPTGNTPESLKVKNPIIFFFFGGEVKGREVTGTLACALASQR